jgi:hypothetical protein
MGLGVEAKARRQGRVQWRVFAAQAAANVPPGTGHGHADRGPRLVQAPAAFLIEAAEFQRRMCGQHRIHWVAEQALQCSEKIRLDRAGKVQAGPVLIGVPGGSGHQMAGAGVEVLQIEFHNLVHSQEELAGG